MFVRETFMPQPKLPWRCADLLLLLAAYGQDATGDVDGDGATNVNDLLLLLAGYGSACTRDAGGGGATCAAGGCATSAEVSIVVDNSHTSYCNGGATKPP